MAKLGYTWYPKDWGNSEKVFELTLLERGLYRELIDMAMLNDNNTVINEKIWARKFGSSLSEIESILLTLEGLNLIELTDCKLFIPSCEPRLNLMRGGSKGGKNKPTPKPIVKPIVKPTPKPTPKQKKRKEIEKKEKEYRSFSHLYLSKSDFDKLLTEYSKFEIDSILDDIENYKLNTNYTSLNLTARKWLKKQYPKNSTDSKSSDPLVEYVKKNIAKYGNS